MGWLTAAYIVVWVVFFVYLFSLDRKQKTLENEVADLNSRLGR